MAIILPLQLCKQHQKQVNAYDRLMQFGDGHFTTMKVINGEIALLDLHIERLSEANQRLDFIELDWAELRVQLMSLAEHLSGAKNSIFKLLISRGESQRGYGFGPETLPQGYLYVSDLPEAKPNQAINLSLIETRLGLQPLLAGMKHTNRLEQVLAKAELARLQLTDGLVLDINDNIVETSIANVFFKMKGRQEWLTPCLKLAGVAGVQRKNVLQNLDKLNISYSIEAIHKDKLESIEAAFISNALQGLVTVSRINTNSLDIDVANNLVSQINVT